MQSTGMVGTLKGAPASSGTTTLKELARQSERALRLRLGRLQLEFSILKRDSNPSQAAGLSPELTDVELKRYAESAGATYRASWEQALSLQYGGSLNLPR